MSSLTIIVPAFNEENRIVSFLERIPRDIPVLLIDKSSYDSTAILAQKHNNVKVLTIPYGPPSSEFHYLKLILKNTHTEWLMLLTIGSAVDERLMVGIKEKIKTTQADIISVPFKNFTFNIDAAFNPWPNNVSKKLVFKKSVANLQPIMHKELAFSSNNLCAVSNKFGYVRHNSNRTVQQLIKKSDDYARYEIEITANTSGRHVSLANPWIWLAKALYNGCLRRRLTIFRGKKGLLLALSFIVTKVFILMYAIEKDEESDEI